MYIHSKVNRTNFLFSFFFVFQFFLLVVDRTKYKKCLITSRVSPLEPLCMGVYDVEIEVAMIAIDEGTI